MKSAASALLGASLILVLCACGGPADQPDGPPPADATPGLGAVPLDITLREVSGDPVEPLAATEAIAQVFVFVRTDCPIANRYAPNLSRLTADFEKRGVPLWLVYVDPEESDETIEAHLEDYALEARALRDDEHALVEATSAAVTPTATLVLRDGTIAYSGRIDARYPGFGKARKNTGREDLVEALDDVLAGRRVRVPRTEAVGCFIADLAP